MADLSNLSVNGVKVVLDVESATVQIGSCTVRCIDSPFATGRFRMRRRLSKVNNDAHVE